MQQTRINSLFTETGSRFSRFFSNPWRRIALILLGFLLGIFVGSAISTTAGQYAQLDVTAAAVIVLFVEWLNRYVYRPAARNVVWLEVANVFKMGVTYGLFLEAFKLGS